MIALGVVLFVGLFALWIAFPDGHECDCSDCQWRELQRRERANRRNNAQ